MTDFTTYLENQIAQWLLNGADMPTAHTSVWVALHDADPTNSGDSNELDAGAGAGGYSRVEVAVGNFTQQAGDGPTVVDNDNDITFPVATEDWPTVTHASLWDGSAGTDNSLVWSALNSNKTVNQDDQLVFRAGDLSFEVD